MRYRLAFIAGLGRGLAAGLLALALAAPAFADAASDKAQLDKLFADLRTAPDPATATAIDQQIWRIWMVPPDPALAGRMAAALGAEASGNLPFAMQLLSRIVTDYPSYPEAWNQRATIEYELDDLDESLADIDKVLALEPRHFGALSGRVLIYLKKGDRPMALKSLLAALAIHPFLAEQQLFPELSQPQTQI